MYRKDAVSASNRISNSLGLGVNVKKIQSLSNGTEEYNTQYNCKLLGLGRGELAG